MGLSHSFTSRHVCQEGRTWPLCIWTTSQRCVCFLLACLPASCISSRFPSWVSSTLSGANPLRAQNPSGPSTLLLQDSEARGTDAHMLMLTLGAVGA